MTTVHSNVPSRRSSPYSRGGLSENEIDQSIRTPILFFVGWALFWLLVSSAFALLASLKLHWPEFLGGAEILTYGRVQAVATNSFLYGWSVSAVFGVAFWTMSRLSQTRLRQGPVLYIAGAFWNLAVILGLIGILFGRSTGLPGLEIPSYTVPVLLISYALIAAVGIYAFHSRQVRTTYVSQWYLFAGFFWFPWIFIAAQAMLVWSPARGTAQAVVSAWYSYNFFALFLAPLGLAVLYYFLPKILGRPIRYYYLTKMGFWLYALIAPWCGVAALSSGPIPAWVPTAGIVGKTMLLIPIAIISLHLFGSLKEGFDKLKSSTTFAFVTVAIFAFLSVHLLQTLTAFRNWQEILQFTHFGTALDFLGKYAFFSFAVFAALYFFLPRITERGWPYVGLIRTHFWCSSIGTLLVILSLGLAGWIQGVRLNNPEVPMVDVAGGTSWLLVIASIGWMILLFGHALFVWNVISLSRSPGASKEAKEILLAKSPEMKVQTT